MKNIPITLISTILYSVSVIEQTAKTSHYKISKKIKVEGHYNWDCIYSNINYPIISYNPKNINIKPTLVKLYITIVKDSLTW